MKYEKKYSILGRITEVPLEFAASYAIYVFGCVPLASHRHRCHPDHRARTLVLVLTAIGRRPHDVSRARCGRSNGNMKVKQEHVDASAAKKSPAKTINSKVFDAFNQLTNNEKVQRINGAVDLLQHLSKSQHEIENKVRQIASIGPLVFLFAATINANTESLFCLLLQEVSYSLQRMVRGVGASTSVSRTGFYTTLAAFLSLPEQNDALTVAHIFEVMDKQLHVGKGASSEKVSFGFSL